MSDMPANNIRALREAKDLTLRGLADRCKAHFTTIDKLESGRMSLTHAWMLEIASALAVEPAALIAGSVALEMLAAGREERA